MCVPKQYLCFQAVAENLVFNYIIESTKSTVVELYVFSRSIMFSRLGKKNLYIFCYNEFHRGEAVCDGKENPVLIL